MARKKTINIIKKVRSAESVISMILGILVVVVVGVLLFRYFRGVITKTKITQESEKAAEAQKIAEQNGGNVPLPTKYTVQEGDNLWEISTKFYGYGFNWGDISRENKLSNPNQIEKGTELTIPDVPVKKPIGESVQEEVKAVTEGVPSITGGSYKVEKGDSLWEISVRAYQDGYKWTEIAKANNLDNPNIIHPGNVLTIPR